VSKCDERCVGTCNTRPRPHPQCSWIRGADTSWRCDGTGPAHRPTTPPADPEGGAPMTTASACFDAEKK
jgi:hypothetical protein